MQTSIAQRMADTAGRPTGFDYLRLGLAAAILCWHSIVTSYGPDVQAVAQSSVARPLVAVLLPAFFTLSGFLVAGSLVRTRTLGMFLGLRALRIFPALAVESLIAALIVGPLLTTDTWAQYFSAPTFHAYFLNILGIPHYFLPGVFEANPFHKVNAQLWTVPSELQCYLMLSAFALLGAVKRRSWFLWATFGTLAVEIIRTAIAYPQWLLMVAGPLPGSLLEVSFLLGALIYLYADRLPWRWTWALASLAVGLVLLDVPGGEWLAVIPIAYATVFFGLTNARKTGLLRGADYSYGIFLYGFVIQQTFVALCPWGRHWWINIAVCLPAATLAAALSWRLVEKPALSLKGQLNRLEALWLSRPKRSNASANSQAAA